MLPSRLWTGLTIAAGALSGVNAATEDYAGRDDVKAISVSLL